jgi:DNA helicase-4
MTGRPFTGSAEHNFLTTAFQQNFGEGDSCNLDTTYRFNSRIGEVANQFIQQNPHQLTKPLNSLTTGDKKAVTLLDESQLDLLLDKLSGFVKAEENSGAGAVPSSEASQPGQSGHPLAQAAVGFYDYSCQQGQQADYVIVMGLHDGNDGFRLRLVSRLWKRRYSRLLKIFLMLKRGGCCMWR